jgi:hypothetical protein
MMSRDGNSSQHIVWSHVYLLLACSLPVWSYAVIILLRDHVSSDSSYSDYKNSVYQVGHLLLSPVIHNNKLFVGSMFEKLFPQLGCLTVGIGDALVCTNIICIISSLFVYCKLIRLVLIYIYIQYIHVGGSDWILLRSYQVVWG